MICPKCKKPINKNDSFCQFCGNKIEEASRQSGNKKAKKKIIISITSIAIVSLILGAIIAVCKSNLFGTNDIGGLTYDDVKLEPVNAKELIEQYGTINREYTFESAENVMSEKDATALFTEKGFTQMEIGTEYDSDGEWMEMHIISNESDSLHPDYYTCYVDEQNRIWKVELMGDIFFADIISSEDGDIGNLLLSEADFVLSYDNETKTFFEFTPDEGVYNLEKDFQITADSLNNYSRED